MIFNSQVQLFMLLKLEIHSCFCQKTAPRNRSQTTSSRKNWTYTTGHVGKPHWPIGKPLHLPVSHLRYPMTPRRRCRTAADWPMQALATLIHIVSLVAMAEITAPTKNGWLKNTFKMFKNMSNAKQDFMWLSYSEDFFPGVPRYSQRMAYEQQTMTSGSTKLPPLGPGAAKAKPPPALSPQTLAFNSWIYRNMCIYIYIV